MKIPKKSTLVGVFTPPFVVLLYLRGMGFREEGGGGGKVDIISLHSVLQKARDCLGVDTVVEREE